MAAPKIATIDTAFRKLIRARDRTCRYWQGFATFPRESNPCSGQLEVAHFIPRSHRNVRCDPDNAVLLCHTHHAFLDTHPLLKADWVRQFLGTEGWERLKSKDVIYTGRDAEKRAELQWLKQKLREIEG